MANNPIKLSVRVVTPRAVARVAPTRPAAYRVRWADMKDSREYDSAAAIPRSDTGMNDPARPLVAASPRWLWNCPDLTHTKFSWQACRQEVCGGEADATSLRSGVQG
jgi:hypothetical protein